jgi:hypothetical protein
MYRLTLAGRGWRPPSPSPTGAVTDTSTVPPPPPPLPPASNLCPSPLRPPLDPGLSLSPFTSSDTMLVTPQSEAGSTGSAFGDSLLASASSLGLTSASACRSTVSVLAGCCDSEFDCWQNHLQRLIHIPPSPPRHHNHAAHTHFICQPTLHHSTHPYRLSACSRLNTPPRLQYPLLHILPLPHHLSLCDNFPTRHFLNHTTSPICSLSKGL